MIVKSRHSIIFTHIREQERDCLVKLSRALACLGSSSLVDEDFLSFVPSNCYGLCESDRLLSFDNNDNDL